MCGKILGSNVNYGVCIRMHMMPSEGRYSRQTYLFYVYIFIIAFTVFNIFNTLFFFFFWDHGYEGANIVQSCFTVLSIVVKGYFE